MNMHNNFQTNSAVSEGHFIPFPNEEKEINALSENVHMWRHKRIMHTLFEWFIRLAVCLLWKMANESTIKINGFHLS